MNYVLAHAELRQKSNIIEFDTDKNIFKCSNFVPLGSE